MTPLRHFLLPALLAFAACAPAQATKSTSETARVDVEDIKHERDRKWTHMLRVRYETSMEVDYMGTRIPWITGCEPADNLRVSLTSAYPDVGAFVGIDADTFWALERKCCEANGDTQCPMGYGGFEMRKGVAVAYINAKLKPWLQKRPRFFKDDPAAWLRGDGPPCKLQITDDMWVDSLDTCADGSSARAAHNARVGLPAPNEE